MRRSVFSHPPLLVLTLFFGVLSCAVIPGRTQSRRPAVITAETANVDSPLVLQGRGVRRIRAVRLDLESFNNAAADTFLRNKRRTQSFTQATELELFPDSVVTVVWSQVERVRNPDGLVWTGTLADATHGIATLAVSGKNVTANINRGDGHLYQIRTIEDRWWIREVDQTNLPKESEPVVPNRK